MDVIIVGAGIGGLTLGLMLERRGIPARIFESAATIRPIGVGISVLPHASRELCELGLREALLEAGVETRESAFFNRFGQRVYAEATGRFAGYDWPQVQIHRGFLQRLLHDAFVAEAGADRVVTDHRFVGMEQQGDRVLARFAVAGGARTETVEGAALIGCDGIHSAVRAQLVPRDGGPVYSGVNMWRGISRWTPFLTGASYIRAGWLNPGKLVIYPITAQPDEEGRQLINWVAEIETAKHNRQDWNSAGRIEDFIGAFADWHFDFLDVPAMLRASETVLEYPMVDKDPLEKWTFGRATLLGDAAHPMYPRGSNGAGQAILDARALADAFAGGACIPDALEAYDGARRPVTAEIIRANRTNPPDVLLREVQLRSGDRPFTRIEDVISAEEMAEITEKYKRVTGSDRQTLAGVRSTARA